MSDNFNLTSQSEYLENLKKQELRDLYLYIVLPLLFVIAFLVVGFYIYKKCSEKKAINEIREIQDNISVESNSFSRSRSSSASRPRSLNIQQNNPLVNENISNILELNSKSLKKHEEAMENLRKKYGNKLLIKYLLTRKIINVNYNNSLLEEFGDVCTICMENFVDKVIISKTPCEHIFHKECFNKYLKGIQKDDKLKCPNCNQNLLLNRVFLKLRNKKNLTLNCDKKKLKNKANNTPSNKQDKEITIIDCDGDSDKNNHHNITYKDENESNYQDNEIITIKQKNRKNNNNYLLPSVGNKDIYLNLNVNNEINIKKNNDDINIFNPIELKINKNVNLEEDGKNTDSARKKFIKLNNKNNKNNETNSRSQKNKNLLNQNNKSALLVDNKFSSSILPLKDGMIVPQKTDFQENMVNDTRGVLYKNNNKKMIISRVDLSPIESN